MKEASASFFSSELWGADYQNGKYPVKIYTIDGVLIYQEELGTTNINKTPLGGVVVQWSVASSMLNTIANPITYYGSGAVINQSGHSGDLYNYYWTSYSRGTDGRGNPNNPLWHNAYLDGYIPLRVKSIYDPCPYLYRIPSNGIWNQFRDYPAWPEFSYIGGVVWSMETIMCWFPSIGWRNGISGTYLYTGRNGFYCTSVPSNQLNQYTLTFNATKLFLVNQDAYIRSQSHSVRCIEDGRCARLSFQLSLTIMHWACSPYFFVEKSMQKLPILFPPLRSRKRVGL